MTRRYPPSPAVSPTTRLLRTIGDLQRRNDDYAPIDDFSALSRKAAMHLAALPAMIAAGVDAGYLEEHEQGAVGLVTKGLHWYLHDEERRKSRIADKRIALRKRT